MKNIKLFLLLFILAGSQLVGAQTSALDNGRGSKASPTTTAEKAAAPAATQDVFRGSDQDIPGKANEAVVTDLFYPAAVEILGEELNASASPRQVVEKLNLLSTKVEALLVANEELRRENELIRKSLNNCCSASAAGLVAEDAYLLQNAPNPFVNNAEIRYFIPEGLTDGRLVIADLMGIEVQAYELNATGLSSQKIDAQRLSAGSYVYTLYVGGKIVDSRIMVITR